MKNNVHNKSYFMRKPVLKKRASAQSDQRLYCALLDSIIPMVAISERLSRPL